jgi:hypothetical protein
MPNPEIGFALSLNDRFNIVDEGYTSFPLCSLNGQERLRYS